MLFYETSIIILELLLHVSFFFGQRGNCFTMSRHFTKPHIVQANPALYLSIAPPL